MNKPTTSVLALILAVLGMLLAGIIIGALAGFLANILYIVFLFPLGVGLAGAFFLEKTLTRAKIRGMAQGILLACLMTAAIYGAYHFTEYALFRARLALAMGQKFSAETGRADPAGASVLVDYALKEETGFSGFPGYILYMDKQGITVGKLFRLGINLGPVLTWVFWVLEAAISGWVTLGAAKGVARRRFCESCNRWYGKETHLGGVIAARAAALTQLLDHRDFARAGALLETDAEVPSLEVYAQSCETCNRSDTWLALKQISLAQNGKLQFKDGPLLSIRPHEVETLLRELRADSRA